MGMELSRNSSCFSLQVEQVAPDGRIRQIEIYLKYGDFLIRTRIGMNENASTVSVQDAVKEVYDVKESLYHAVNASTEELQSGARERIKNAAKNTVKDSVFRDLFGIQKYLLQLYQALHPEAGAVTEKAIHAVTIKHILLDQLYNDLGFVIGNHLLVLVEAQSTWSVNIIVRSLMYLAQTWQEYIVSSGQNVYGSKRVKLC